MVIGSLPGQGNTSEGKKDYSLMTFEELEKDSVAGPILQQMALQYLQTEDREYFQREFLGELTEDGYLVGKNSRKRTKPSQNIGGGKAMSTVLEATRMSLNNKT